MPVNLDKPERWKADIAQSVDLYNAWFLEFAPKAFRDTRVRTTNAVESTLKATENLTNVKSGIIRQNPSILPTLRMSTCPPLARDRLIGLAGVSKSLVERMEKEGKLPVQLGAKDVDVALRKIGAIIERLADRDVFPWLEAKTKPSAADVRRAATIVADRLCGATADPIVRNTQEARQLRNIGEWLNARGYKRLPPGSAVKFNTMPPGTYAFRMNVQVKLGGSGQSVNIPVDTVIMPKKTKRGILPLMIEAKSAGDFTNVNKRRKEEAKKVEQLRATYGTGIQYILFLCGYFDSGYLGYEAAEGIDWVWEHRIDDLRFFGL
jgi:hypothetical protein